MRFIAIIPARYASTRFPGKPLADIAGKTMIERVYERVAAEFDDVYVATDDARIELAAKAFGAKVVITSPDHRSGTDRCAEALEIIERLENRKFDVVVNVQGDEPFVSPEHLAAICGCFDDRNTQIATLVKKFSAEEDVFNSNSPKVVFTTEDFAIYFSRSVIPFLRSVDADRWAENHTFWKHVGLYGYRSEVLREITALPQGELEVAESLEQLRWIENGYRIKIARVTTQTIAIDTPEDLAKVLTFF